MSRDGHHSMMIGSFSFFDEGDACLDDHHSDYGDGESSKFFDNEKLLNVQLCTSSVSWNIC